MLLYYCLLRCVVCRFFTHVAIYTSIAPVYTYIPKQRTARVIPNPPVKQSKRTFDLPSSIRRTHT